MNHGLVGKSIRELWPATVMCGLLAAVFEGLVAFILPRFQAQMGAQILEMEFVRRVIEGMLGTRIADQLGPEIIRSIPWAHPIMLALVLAHAVICCTRMPAGEVDRGTIDIALGLPISRWQWMWTDTVVWIGSALIVIVMAVIGNAVGSSIVSKDRVMGLHQAGMIFANLLGLYLAVGAGAWLISSLGNRRGKVITTVFVLIVASFLVSYLEQFWEPARYAGWFSALSYYRPAEVLRSGQWPVRDLCVLYGASTVLWGCAAAVFIRRDLCTT